MTTASENRKKNARFRSRSEHMLDDKGRLNIPSRFMDILKNSFANEELVITNWKTCLKVYPSSQWETVENTLIAKGKSEPGMESLYRYLISGVCECMPDKQGRILLPQSLRNDFLSSREIILNGMLDHFEIWDKGAWDAERRLARENFSDYAPSLARIGIL